jgi:hypothetical protein
MFAAAVVLIPSEKIMPIPSKNKLILNIFDLFLLFFIAFSPPFLLVTCMQYIHIHIKPLPNNVINSTIEIFNP